MGVFRQRMSQFNGCVPYAGVSTGTRVDEAVLPVLFALLPVPQPVGITVAPPSVKVRDLHSISNSHATCHDVVVKGLCTSAYYLYGTVTACRGHHNTLPLRWPARFSNRGSCLSHSQAAVQMVAVLQCLQRLTSSRFASADMVISPSYASRIFSALTCGDDAVAAEAARLLTRLWAPAAGRVGRGPWQIGRTFTLADDDPRAVNTNDDNLTARAGVSVLGTCGHDWPMPTVTSVYFSARHIARISWTHAAVWPSSLPCCCAERRGMRHQLGVQMHRADRAGKPSLLAPRAGKSVCLTGLPRIAGLLHVLRAERGPSPVLALAIVEVRGRNRCSSVELIASECSCSRTAAHHLRRWIISETADGPTTTSWMVQLSLRCGIHAAGAGGGDLRAGREDDGGHAAAGPAAGGRRPGPPAVHAVRPPSRHAFSRSLNV